MILHYEISLRKGRTLMAKQTTDSFPEEREEIILDILKSKEKFVSQKSAIFYRLHLQLPAFSCKECKTKAYCKEHTVVQFLLTVQKLRKFPEIFTD